MIKKIGTTSFLLLSISIFSQVQIKVQDAENQKPVPYARLILKDKKYYKNTEENGEAILEKGEEISGIESFGYENLVVTKQENTYSLRPLFKEIDAVKIAVPMLKNRFKIGKIEKSRVFFGAIDQIWIIGKEIITENNSGKPLFLKSFKFASSLLQKTSATIKVNFYYNNNGTPGEQYKSFIVTCQKKQNFTEFQVPKPFLFPEEGLIVGFEWIFNTENTYKKVIKLNGQEKERTGIDPLIGSIRENPGNFVSGYLDHGNWKFVNSSKESNISLGNLGIEIEFTN